MANYSFELNGAGVRGGSKDLSSHLIADAWSALSQDPPQSPLVLLLSRSLPFPSSHSVR